MRDKKDTDIAVVVSFVLLMAILLAACGSTGSTNNVKPISATACADARPQVAADTPTIAILGETGSKLAWYKQDIDMVVNTAATEKAHIIVNGVSASGNAPDLLSNVVLDGEGNNNLERTQNLTCKTTVVNDAIAALQKGVTPKQPDAFDAITTLAGNLDKDPSRQPIDVVLLTPLSAVAGGVDLSKPGTLDDPVAAINTLAKKGLIPSCANVRFYGVSPDAGLSDVDAAKLREFWLLYAKKCGGEFVAWTNHLATFPVSSAITPTDYSQIKVVTTPKKIIATLGSDVLFGADSAALRAAATPALKKLLVLTRQNTGRIVITGYVNPIVPGSNTSGDLTLSKQRGRAVADWLIAHGVVNHRVSIVGKGTADAVYPRPKTDAQREANRRVVAVIYTNDK